MTTFQIFGYLSGVLALVAFLSSDEIVSCIN
jgi:hypothetical protein